MSSLRFVVKKTEWCHRPQKVCCEASPCTEPRQAAPERHKYIRRVVVSLQEHEAVSCCTDSRRKGLFFSVPVSVHLVLGGMNDFVWGLKNGDLDQVIEAVEKGTDVNVAIEGRPPLCLASDYGQLEIIKYLLEKGANVESTDKHGITALLAAIWEGHTQCVKVLLEAGANKNGTAPDGTSYLDAAEKDEIKALLR
ncbi:myotrophin-like isoform X2 [Scylla paramamosain]|uniref:myotrophin-like isoform X2 n=1 Tax=Scylla paramamosain TaxID=85552 RepID=UPI00308352AF